jgi:hypothetical protein
MSNHSPAVVPVVLSVVVTVVLSVVEVARNTNIILK